MAQHSVTWACVASIPLVTAGLCLCLSFSDRGALAGLNGTPARLQPALRQLISDEESPAINGNSREAMIPATSGFVLSVPGNSIVVIGSLDLSGAPHVVDIVTEPSSSSPLDHHSAVTPSTLNCVSLSSSDVTLSSDRQPDGTHCFSCRSSGPHDDDPGIASSNELCSVTVSAPDCAEIRRFLVPHFEQSTIVNEAADTTLVVQSPRAAVYLDHSLYRNGMLQRGSIDESRLTETAGEFCGDLDARLLDHVTKWIGPVADLDGDQRLTVVITDLDRRKIFSDAPVLGCVRERDFLTDQETDLSGDILYLDHRIPSGKSLESLLVHELTHAAIFSLTRQSRIGPEGKSACLIPSWLNEATAHLVERTVAADPAGFAQRVGQFRADPAGSPIVASEPYLSFSARRSGSRASGTLFLEQIAGSPDVLRAIIQSTERFNRRVESITGRPFHEVFRSWSVDQAQAASRCAMENSENASMNTDRRSKRLFGTAFFCLRCVEPIQRLQIASDSHAELQITVIAE